MAGGTQIALFSSLVSLFVAALSALWTYLSQSDLEKLRSESQKDLEELRGRIERANSLADAKQAYEFDARKNLYLRTFPLLFQLKEAAESSYYRVVNLIGSYRENTLIHLAEETLVRDGDLDRRQYYLNSTLYRLFLPLAIYRQLQRSTTFFDFTLDDEISAKYFLLKIAFICFTDPFGIAKTDRSLCPYEPDNLDWRNLRKQDPARYWRQGMLTGHLERICDSMIVDTKEGSRAMTYGEFERAAAFDGEFQQALGPAIDVFIGFRFDRRPVLARVLLMQACIMRLLFIETKNASKPREFLELVDEFTASLQAHEELQWWDEGSDDVWNKVRSYLSDRINWVFPTGKTPDF
jgi:hypothetical protein